MIRYLRSRTSRRIETEFVSPHLPTAKQVYLPASSFWTFVILNVLELLKDILSFLSVEIAFRSFIQIYAIKYSSETFLLKLQGSFISVVSVA